MMKRDMSQARAFFPRIEALMAALTEAERQEPSFTHALAEISADDGARDQYMALSRHAQPPAMRARMIALAANLGWLSPEAQRVETLAMINDMLAGSTMGYAEVDLVCALNKDRHLDPDLSSVRASARGRAPQAAALACLGDTDAHGQVLRALASADDKDVQVAQVYLRHRPISDSSELRDLAKVVTRMTSSGAQVRALDTLARLHIADREIFDELARSFASARSVHVQRAIAEVFIRSDPKAIAKSDLMGVIRQHRLRPPGGGEDLIDVLMRRLQAS
jgi:hypothetical protein